MGGENPFENRCGVDTRAPRRACRFVPHGMPHMRAPHLLQPEMDVLEVDGPLWFAFGVDMDVRWKTLRCLLTT